MFRTDIRKEIVDRIKKYQEIVDRISKGGGYKTDAEADAVAKLKELKDLLNTIDSNTKKPELSSINGESLVDASKREALRFLGELGYGHTSIVDVLSEHMTKWQKERLAKIVKYYFDHGDKCMEQSNDAKDQGGYTFWDGFNNCAECILRDLEDSSNS